MKITVIGHAKSSLQPEEATLHLQLGFEHSDKQQAVRQATELAHTVAAEFKSLTDSPDSGVTATTLLPLGVRSWRPWVDGQEQPLRHGASSPASITFTDFRALSTFVDAWAKVPGVQVGHVVWDLTEASRKREQEAVLTRAVADAHAKALTIARAADDGAVTFVEISDQLSSTVEPRPMMARMAMDSAASDDGGVDLTPEDIDVEQQIQAVLTTD